MNVKHSCERNRTLSEIFMVASGVTQRRNGGKASKRARERERSGVYRTFAHAHLPPSGNHRRGHPPYLTQHFILTVTKP